MHGLADQPALVVDALSVRYGGRPALRDVTFHVHPGELVALVGPNGAGKSTLLHSLMGQVAHEGDVVVHGRSARRRRATAVGFVPQRQAVDLDFPITVGQVVAAGCGRLRWPGSECRAVRRRRVARALARVGLDGLEKRPLNALSGGQAQRVFLARALAREVDVLLLDEPLTGVDTTTTHALVDLFAALADQGAALLLATHDLALVRDRFARCLTLNRSLLGDGAPRDVLAPDALPRIFTHV